MSNVTKPDHYNSHPSGIECRVIARHHNFNIGNVIKYVWRAGMKDNAPMIDDLQKAADYLNDEIKMLQEKDILGQVAKARRKLKKALKKLRRDSKSPKEGSTTNTTAEDLPALALKKQKRLVDQDFYYFSIDKYFHGVWVNKEYINSLDIKKLGDKHEHVIYFGDLQPLYLEYLERMKNLDELDKIDQLEIYFKKLKKDLQEIRDR